MTIIVDLIIIAIIVLCVIMGYIKGLTGAIIKILSFVLSIVIAFILFIPISNLVIDKTQIDESITESVREMIIGNNDQSEVKETMPSTITEYIGDKVESAGNSAKEAVADTTAREVAITIVKAATWIILFIVARILLILLRFITALIAKLPVIKQCDKLGGIIYGLLEGLVIVYVILAIISLVSPMMNGTIANLIDNSYLGSMMYNNNLLLKIIF
jgi:uncharacterized membrane protein required for colicin V production